jgi:hypothetical protein
MSETPGNCFTIKVAGYLQDSSPLRILQTKRCRLSFKKNRQIQVQIQYCNTHNQIGSSLWSVPIVMLFICVNMLLLFTAYPLQQLLI